MQRYFVDNTVTAKQNIKLKINDQKHLFNVMRAKSGDQVEIVSSEKSLWLGEVADDRQIIHILKPIDQVVELPIKVTIACGISKGEKMDWIVQKGTELGATEFIFFSADYSIARWNSQKIEKKLQRLAKIAKSASEQSHRLQIPTIQYVKNANELVRTSTASVKLVAYEESAKNGEMSNLVSALQNIVAESNLLVVFGPEGGISPAEIELFDNNNYSMVGLGPRILRAETAPLYILSAVSYQLELIKGMN